MKTQPVVLHIISSLNRGGKERQLATIYKYNDLNKYKVKICYLNDGINDYTREYNILSEDLLKIASKSTIGRFLQLFIILSKTRPDLLFAWGPLETVLCLPYSIINAIPLINGSIRHGARLKKWSHFIRMVILHISPHIVANSRAGLLANKLKRGYVLYNGIDKKFETILSARHKIEKKQKLIGPVGNKHILVSVANFVPAKDFFTVIEALNELKKEEYRFLYIILGEGVLRDSVQQFIYNKNLTEDVLIRGQVDNVQDFLSISDVFIHSSRGEGCSNAILEAMFKSLPIVASNVGGTKEITSSQNALLFQYKDVKSLKEKLKKMFDDPSLRVKMGSRSHDMAKQMFTVEKMMQRYYEIIEKIMRKG